MPRFSLRQIFFAVTAFSGGFAIWRLPKASWGDIPLVALSLYFVVSLSRHAAATRRVLIEQDELPREQRWGCKLLIAGLIGTAAALILALVFTYLAAAELLLTTPKDNWLDYVRFPALPRDLAILAMLVATGLGSWQHSPAKETPGRKKVYEIVAAGCTLVVVIAYWMDRMVTWFLVYLALSGVEAAQPPRWLPPEINVDTAVRIHRFTLVSFAGLPLAVANLLLVGGLVKWWRKPRLRSMLAICLAAGLAAECWLARWIGVEGMRQLSPPFQEAMHVPPLAAIIIVAAMILLAVGAFSWRSLGKSQPAGHSVHGAQRTVFFHENWTGSLLLGMVAILTIAISFIDWVIKWHASPFWSSFQTIAYGLTERPAQLLWLAAAIGGFGLAWLRWKRRKVPVADVLPCVDPALFAATMLGLSILVVAATPIVAAVSFSLWFLRLGEAF